MVCLDYPYLIPIGYLFPFGALLGVVVTLIIIIIMYIFDKKDK